MTLLYLAMLVAGLFAGFALFAKVPKLNSTEYTPENQKISIIIPARNEEKNIANLLKDLQNQHLLPRQIICVDDGSTDNTANVIKNFDVEYIFVRDKPSGWTGKTHACQTGALAAKENILIFIDADVRLGPFAISKIAAQCKEKIVSVQPYHAVSKFYQQFALFFSAVGIAANGVACPLTSKKAGLFGPIIAISKTHFGQIGGFSQVCQSVIEDVALGKVIEDEGLEYSLFVGDKELSFCMYSSFKELFFGFAKNFSSGAAKTPFVLFALSFLWVTALTATPIVLIQALFLQNATQFAQGIFLYALFVWQLRLVSKRLGSFSWQALLAYPVFLSVFHLVFLCSLYAKIFAKKTRWKGRDIILKK